MKNRKVLNLRTHIGGLHGKTSYDSEKDRADMELWPIGILLKGFKGSNDILIPFANVVEVVLEKPQEETTPTEEKRGPGRPKLGMAS